jgi:16S rRNA (uracil1498-N3)-methyltransferase
MSVAICIGPEGGFSEKEMNVARNEGFAALYLGERRLRTETAATIAISLATIR